MSTTTLGRSHGQRGAASSAKRRSSAGPRSRRRRNYARAARLFAYAIRLCLLGVVLAGAAYWYWPVLRSLPQVRIESLRIVGCPEPGQAAVQSVLQPYLGRSMFDVPLIREQVAGQLAAVPELREATLSRRWPRQLVLSIRGREPVAVAKTAESWLSVDAQGRGMRYYDTPPACLLAVSGVPSSGDPTAPGVSTTELRLTERISDVVTRTLGHQPKEVSVGAGQAITVRLTDGDTVRLGQASELVAKLMVYRAIRQQRQGAARYIDVSDPAAPVIAVKQSG